MKKLNRGGLSGSGVCFKTPQRLRPKCDDLQIYGVFTGKYLGRHQNAAGRRLSGPRQ